MACLESPHVKMQETAAPLVALSRSHAGSLRSRGPEQVPGSCLLQLCHACTYVGACTVQPCCDARMAPRKGRIGCHCPTTDSCPAAGDSLGVSMFEWCYRWESLRPLPNLHGDHPGKFHPHSCLVEPAASKGNGRDLENLQQRC